MTPPQIEQAIDAMKGLEAAVAASGNGQSDQLMRIYISLAEGAQRAIGEAARGGPGGRRRPAERHVRRVPGSHQPGTGGQQLGHALLDRTDVLHDGRKPASGRRRPSQKAAAQYFTKARDAFEKLAAEAEKDPSVLPSPTAQARRRRSNWATVTANWANIRRRSTRFPTVLAEQESQLTVQQAAARTYQRWGEAGGGVKKLERAIYGGYQAAVDRQEPHLGLAQAGARGRAGGAVRSEI